MPWGAIGGATIGALGSLAGGILNNNASSHANDKAIAHAEYLNEQNIAYQKEFAKNGLRWKVDDVKAAGLHPLTAMGATGTQFQNVTASPNIQSADYSYLSDIGNSMGQAVQGALSKKKTTFEKQIEGMKLQQAQLELESKGADIEHTRMLTAKVLKDMESPSIPTSRRSYDGGQNPSNKVPIPKTHMWAKDPTGKTIQIPNPDVLQDRDFYSELKEMGFQLFQDVSRLWSGAGKYNSHKKSSKRKVGYYW